MGDSLFFHFKILEKDLGFTKNHDMINVGGDIYMEKKKARKCVLCGCELSGYGNNAEPLAEGLCCNKCNSEKVIPARIKAELNEVLKNW